MEAVWWQEGQSCRSWYRYAEHWLRTALASIYNTNHIGFTIFLYKLSIIASCIHKCNLRCYIWNSDRGQQNKTKIRNCFEKCVPSSINVKRSCCRRPLWLLVRTPSALEPMLASRLQEHYPSLANLFIYFWNTLFITLHDCVMISMISPLWLVDCSRSL